MKIKLTLLALALASTAFTGVASAHDRCGHMGRVGHERGCVGRGHFGHFGHWYGGRWIDGSVEVASPVEVAAPVVETYAAPVAVDTDTVVEEGGVGGCYSDGVWYRGHGHFYGHGFGRGHGFSHGCAHGRGIAHGRCHR